jgi:hypothetical protein
MGSEQGIQEHYRALPTLLRLRSVVFQDASVACRCGVALRSHCLCHRGF